MDEWQVATRHESNDFFDLIEMYSTRNIIENSPKNIFKV